jgi:hypothetical protein
MFEVESGLEMKSGLEFIWFHLSVLATFAPLNREHSSAVGMPPSVSSPHVIHIRNQALSCAACFPSILFIQTPKTPPYLRLCMPKILQIEECQVKHLQKPKE